MRHAGVSTGGHNQGMLPFLHGDPDPSALTPLQALTGQRIIHTAVERRGTRCVFDRGWVIESREQRLADIALTLRDPRALGARCAQSTVGRDGDLLVTLDGPAGPLPLETRAPWTVTGPYGVVVRADHSGQVSSAGPSGPVHATAEALARHRESSIGGVERAVLRAAQNEPFIHPGHVVAALTQAGAVADDEFERRGPLVLARLLVRGELEAGFVTDGAFSAWSMPIEQIIEHIGTTWLAIGGREPGRDMIAWFRLTDQGRDALGPTGVQALGPGMSGYDSPGVVGRHR